MAKSKKYSTLIWLGGLLYATWLLLLLSLPYLELKPGIDFLKTKALVYHIKHWRLAFYTHVFSSIFVIFMGIFQFIPQLIVQQPRIHRVMGYIYVITLLCLAGPSGLVLALYANGGWIAQIGFTSLALFWMTCTVISLRCVFKRNIAAHRNWMIRSYALTLAAVTLRFYGYMFDVLKLDFQPVHTYQFLAFASWIPNLIIAEWIIHMKVKSLKNLIS